MFGTAAFRADEANRTEIGAVGEARWTYAVSKLAGEHLAKAYHQEFGMPVVTLRPFNVYGPGQSLSNPYTGIVSLFARLAKAGKTIPVYEDGEIIRDFVFIDDVAAALLRVAVAGQPHRYRAVLHHS